MKSYQQAFIEMARNLEALKFGNFTLKSGRVSPYFFNSGSFCSGAALAQLGQCYASALVESGLGFDMLLGPAYKGIPLVTSVAVSLSRDHGLDTPFAYNRKEAKDHGEAGLLVGAPLQGRVLVIDDLITAGTAVREVIGMVREHGAQCVGVAVGLDRQERGQGKLSAIQELEQEFGLTVISIINFRELIAHLRESGAVADATLRSLEAYRASYGVSS
ncbi:MAG: orotate phosphoribosyltransferase [Halieaceae bacterium]|nr:orotate phosphoribosyltransferase [Halieaceae bacterium]